MTAVKLETPRQPGRWGKRLLIHILLISGAFVMTLPFLWMVSTSLKTRTDVLSEYPPRLIPATFLISNYATALTSLPFERFYVNSLLVACSVTLLQLFTASLSAFAFARL